MSASESYKKAGVDTEEGRNFASRIGKIAAKTRTPHVLTSAGGFSGLLDAAFLKDYKNPVLLSTTDGVGTKLQLARAFNLHHTVGIDLVGMCSNDILAAGGRPLLFLDYIACGKLDTEKMLQVGQSIADGCLRAGAALLGGETAEHPGVMPDDEYDLAGFMVGVAEKDRLVDGNAVRPGDVLIGLPSSGIHSNGLSLVRRLYMEEGKLPENPEEREFLKEQVLLRPTIIYEPVVRPLLESSIKVTGIAHITGGGFYENLPRILKPNLGARIRRDRLVIPELFHTIARKGNIPLDELFSVFNMGTGMVLSVPADQEEKALQILGESIRLARPVPEGLPCTIGEIVSRDPGEPEVAFH